MLENSKKLFVETQKIIPGGVNSPVRACKAVSSHPVFIAKAKGSKIYDVDNNEYLDFVSSWGPLIWGHSCNFINEAIVEALNKGTSYGAPTEAETKFSEVIQQALPSIEMLRLVNSGTEASMSAIRLARGYTKKEKIIKFKGCYHGHADSLLVEAGSGVLTLGIPGSPGVPKALANLTLSLPYNNLEVLEETFLKYGGDIAAVIVEPVAGNMGVIPAKKEFLAKIAYLCKKYESVFICDEVITGFRVSLQGAQGHYGIKPDITILGKIIGAGLPLAAFGGRREIMSALAPLGDVYQAGTLSGNPLAVAAGMASVKALIENKDKYDNLEKLTEKFASGLLLLAEEKGLEVKINRVASMFTVFFNNVEVVDYNSALKSDVNLYAKYWQSMLKYGIYLGPSQFETSFISLAHTEDDLAFFLDGVKKVFNNF